MNLLVDAWLSHRLSSALTEAGHDAVWVGNQERPPSDPEVLAQARRDGRVVVTLDKDFGELVVAARQPHPGVIRLVDLALTEQLAACLRVLKEHSEDLAAGALLTVTADRVRVRSRT